jgi:hypothetical protein
MEKAACILGPMGNDFRLAFQLEYSGNLFLFSDTAPKDLHFPDAESLLL